MRTTRAWYSATAGAVALILLAGYFLLISPRRSGVADLRAQTQTAEGTSTTLLAQLGLLRTQASGLAVEQRRLRRFEDKMPPTVAMPALIRSLNGAANTSEAELMSLAPVGPVLPTATTGAVGSTPTATVSGAVPTPTSSTEPPVTGGLPPASVAGSGVAPYSVVTLAMTVQGSYFVLQRFFIALESLPRALVLTSVALAPLAATTTAGSTGTPVLTATLTGSAYVSALPAVPVASLPGAVPTPTPTTPPGGNALAPRAGAASTRK